MVKQVVRWETEDGREFHSKEEAEKHDLRMKKVDEVFHNLSICKDREDALDLVLFIETNTKGWK